MKLCVPMLVVLSLWAVPAAAADTAAAQVSPAAKVEVKKPDLAAGQAKYEAANCTSCHNADGNSAIADNPKLAGQHYAYLVEQLANFSSGKRPSAIMAAQVKDLSVEDMQNIAAFLASKKMKLGVAKSRELAALGEKIYRGGVADRQISACAGCHSPNGVGMPKAYPRLAGQHAQYVAAQIFAFRDGGRKSTVMSSAVDKLNDREVKALADYIAGLR